MHRLRRKRRGRAPALAAMQPTNGANGHKDEVGVVEMEGCKVLTAKLILRQTFGIASRSVICPRRLLGRWPNRNQGVTDVKLLP